MATTFPIQIHFHNIDPSEAVEYRIRQHAEKLGQLYPKIMDCHVTISTHKHQHQGRIYHVIIDIDVPHSKFVANRDLAKNHAHEDIFVAIRDAFAAMKRQLLKFADKQEGEVKHHQWPEEGRVIEIAPIADFGLIETINGRRIRFSSKSVIAHDFDKLEIGDRVSFVEVISNGGSAASTVYVN